MATARRRRPSATMPGTVLTNTTPGSSDRYQYTAREWDSVMGFGKPGTRVRGTESWYSVDPSMLQPDTNPYRFEKNDSAVRRDPSGLDSNKGLADLINLPSRPSTTLRLAITLVGPPISIVISSRHSGGLRTYVHPSETGARSGYLRPQCTVLLWPIWGDFQHCLSWIWIHPGRSCAAILRRTLRRSFYSNGAGEWCQWSSRAASRAPRHRSQLRATHRYTRATHRFL